MQNLIHGFVLSIGLLCLSPFAIPRYSIVLRNIPSLRNRYTDKVSGKLASLNKRLEKEAAKALSQLRKPETAIRKKLSKIYSSAPQDLLLTAISKYIVLKQIRAPGVPGKYFPRSGTFSTALKFLTPYQHTGP